MSSTQARVTFRWFGIFGLGLLPLAAALGCSGGNADPVSVEQAALTTTTVSFQDGQLPTTAYAGTRDTMLDGGSQSTNNGTDKELSVVGDDQLESLISWDISGAIPTTATVTAASISLQVSDKSEENFTFYEAKAAWNETKATWKVYDSSKNWQVAGGSGATDRGTTALGSFSADPTGSYVITLNAAGIALVQSWARSPAGNHGLFLVGPSTSNRLEFRSREYGTKNQRPKLTVTWNDGGGSGSGGAGGTGAGGAAGASGAGAAAGTGGSGGTGEITLDPTPGNYKSTCDGSLGVMLDATHFLDGNDEEQGMRVYTRGANAAPLKTIDISSKIGLSTSDEADLEDAARVGNRIYVVSSHGRDKNGNLERSRYRFFAMDVSGTVPNISLAVPGYSSTLLDAMLVTANWVTPNSSVISTLNTAANLGDSTDADLAPKVNGTNIEGLAWVPTAQRPNQLMLGFRNPAQSSDAIVVSLLNADAVLGGATPSFGEAILLDLGGLRVRAMTWSPLHHAVLMLGGAKDASTGPFRLYEWSGAATDAPVAVQDITTAPTDSAPEAIVVYDNTRDVQVLFDQGDHLISGTACKDKSSSSQFFSDVIVHVP